MRGASCNLCGSSEAIPLFSTRDYITHTMHNLVKCKSCGLTYVNPQLKKDELPAFYPATYYGGKPFFYEIVDAHSRYKWLHKIVGKHTGKLLDVGCGKGLLLKLFAQSGWEVAGIELSDNSARYATEVLGLRVLNKDIDNCDFSEESFDLITSFHSLEHLNDPLSALKTIGWLLKPDSLLIVQVPRYNSFYSKIFGDRWFHLDVPRHLYHFNDQTLEKLLERAGFHIFKRKKFVLMHDAFGALQSILNLLCSRMNLLNDLNTKRVRLTDIIKARKKRPLIDAMISLSLQTLVFPLLFFLAALFAVFNTGGTLTYYAKKTAKESGAEKEKYPL